ncbi:multidrug efflux SMR transporter [Pantoea sp. Acro-807]|uniref:DMT family transporter n=1 Tax=Pantoea sp. Acro-807 TaxID=2608356 RepID=UPI001419C3C0|nr:multidrug efflux SMR transporter [Pantoea sp. Acro-807]NIE72708.1 multidrug efflux SMR transporter [Pantoea sp. Acro-807]
MSWIYILTGGLLEIGFTTCMRYTDGFRNVPWTLAFLACIAGSMFFLEMGTRNIPIGTAYAVWTGIGALGTVLIGMIWYHEPATLIRLLLILVLVGSVAGLKLTSGH